LSTITRLSTTNISATGVSTFTDIDLSGTADLTNVYTSGIGTFTRSFATNLNVSGVSTFGNNIVAQANLDVDGLTTLDDVNVSSAATITKAEVSALNVSGVTTSAGGFIGNVTGNITGTSGGLSGSPNITVSALSATTTKLGITTALSLGIGTDTANAEIQIHKPTGSSSIVIGQNSNTDDNNLELRYGGGASSYSTANSVDLLNHGDGNLNSFVTGTGNFNWIQGTNSALMTLSNSGNLGIGVVSPTDKLNVNGNATFVGVTTFTGNVTISNALTVPILNIADVSANLVGNVNSLGISTFAQLNVKGASFSGIGIGTTSSGNHLTAGQEGNVSQRVFIGRDMSGLGGYGGLGVGIRTSYLSKLGTDSYNCLEIYGSACFHGGGFKVGGAGGHTNSVAYRSAVDFSDVVELNANGTSLANRAYMIFPRLDTSQRNSLRDGTTQSTTLRSGAIIYNTDSNRLELWTGGGWCGIATVV
jgi:hypothetical protein